MSKPNEYWGATPEQRYPKGSPLAGRFKPKGYTLPPLAAPLPTVDNVIQQLPPKRRSDLARVVKAANASLERSSGAFAKEYGLSPRTAALINAKVAEHLGTLLAMKPEVAPPKLTWERMDGMARVSSLARVDHAKNSIVLNGDILLNPARREFGRGDALKAVTHEVSHLVDRDKQGRQRYTELFRPLHEFLSDYTGEVGPQRWQLEKKLAYPLSGYFGMVNPKKSALSLEYVSTLSELFWHDPARLRGLDDHFEQLGYPASRLTDTMARIWGVSPRENGTRRLNNQDLKPLQPSDLGLPGLKPSVQFDPGNSVENPLEKL